MLFAFRSSYPSFVYSGFECFAVRTFRANSRRRQCEMNCEKCQNESVKDL